MDRELMEWMKPFQKTFDQNFFKSFHHLFDNSQEQNKEVKVNLYEGINEILCVVFLPGIKDVDTISLKVQGNIVSVGGYFNIEFENFRSTQQEFENANFKRVIELPYTVREDKVDAEYKHGLLIIHLYRLLTGQHQENRIPIKNLED
ncbi:Hsp20/alpha crystallin family protein [Anaerobacillus alkaliphilus]|uniref:Hsp20/alpha crystallin family protein n=1 Tax=Anaerobacillus alkaliphilus TaxID=1548597 RepID=A0A4Q0VS18_9BACI|nr:Hsp20/alpha crystallin family protein [Anaerobacillus alkaliphilus]RXI98210.1 Hsp20/alpha crystallin family protein [Anaerobacillus alkaliphilus]